MRIHLQVHEVGEGSLKAYGRIVLEQSFVVRGLRFTATEEGMEIQWPHLRRSDGTEFCIARLIEGAAGDCLEDAILTQYQARVSTPSRPGILERSRSRGIPRGEIGEHFKVTDVGIKLVDSPMVKALVALELCGALVVRGIRLVESSRGRMVAAMPFWPDRGEIAHPIGPGPARDVITDAIVSRYAALTGGPGYAGSSN